MDGFSLFIGLAIVKVHGFTANPAGVKRIGSQRDGLLAVMGASIAQETDARSGHGGRLCTRPTKSNTAVKYQVFCGQNEERQGDVLFLPEVR